MNIHPGQLAPCDNCGTVFVNVIYAVAHEARCRVVLKPDDVVITPM